MSIAKMKRLQMIALDSDRDALMERMVHLGCVHLSEVAEEMQSDESLAFLKREQSQLADRQAQLRQVQNAMAALTAVAPAKGGMLQPRPQVSGRDFLKEESLREALAAAEEINAHTAQIGQLQAQTVRLQTERMTLLPWQELDIPLELDHTRTTKILLGTLPSAADWQSVCGQLADEIGEAELYLLSESSDQKCVLLLCHTSVLDETLELLRGRGFALSQLTGMTGTVAENVRRLDEALQETEKALQSEKDALVAMASRRPELQQCVDRMELEIRREESRERLLSDGCIFCLEGWVPAKKAPKLEETLGQFDCAWDLRDPAEEEYPEVPVKLENNRFTRSLNGITEMYSLPAYNGVDPNPLMAPFFILFFGMMMADMAYGILMIIGSLVYLKKARPAEAGRNFAELILWCGVATFVVGAMTGGFFGDFIPQLLKLINPESTFEMPALFTPLNDTVAILVGSLALGVVQVFTGMAISVVKKVKDGHVADAIWDEVTWWVLLTGLVLMILKVGNIGGVPVVLCIGGVMLLYGSTYQSKGIGKVGSFIATVYNGVTGFFSDILSYVRLMALMLAGSVLAQVFNTLGSVFGSVIGFVIISLIGNALNLALNLLGCYVHDMRLQFLEFFGRFYQEGGKAYTPLSLNDTKYVEIIKEEK